MSEKKELEKDENEKKDWINKVVEIAKRENLPISGIEEYGTRTVIRFALPENPEEEADVYVWYKKVECFQELADELKGCRYLEGYKGKIREIMEEEIVEKLGYQLDSNYDAFVKGVKTPEEAIEEVKLMIKDTSGQTIGKLLIDTYETIKSAIEDAIRNIEKLSGKSLSKEDKEVKYILRLRHKIPKWMKDEIEKRGGQDKAK